MARTYSWGISQCIGEVYVDVLDETECQIVTEENNRKTVGRPSEMKMFCYSAMHGKGIMTAVVRRMLHAWIVPRMSGNYIAVFMFAGDVRSERAREKNGFVEVVVRGGKKNASHMGWRVQTA
ncbi:hypothetical protein EDC04DRAFT_2670436 [Pisolithus marmoratus]|nr:hypothetical protein EDC04DRAFT_2670436 [Pisolithus marmoratus]